MSTVGVLVVGGVGGLEVTWRPTLEEWGDRTGWRCRWAEMDKRMAREFSHGLS